MKYLVTAFTGLGNFIQQSVIYARIREIDPSAEIVVVGDNVTGALDCAARHPFIGSVISIPPHTGMYGRMRLFRSINQQRFDMILLPLATYPGWFRLINYIGKSPRIVQHINVTHMYRVELLQMMTSSRKVVFVPFVQGRHEIDLYHDLVEVAFNKHIRREYRTEVLYEGDSSVGRRFALPERYVCIQPGAAGGLRTVKRWPAEHFAAFIRMIFERLPGTGVVIIGAEHERKESVEPVIKQCPGVVDTSGETGFNDLANIVAGASLVVCHDSGVMHLANALEVPLIALYGPTDYTRTAPLGSRSLVLRKDIDCSPCMYGSSVSEDALFRKCGSPRCMRAITPEEVFVKAAEVLKTQC